MFDCDDLCLQYGLSVFCFLNVWLVFVVLERCFGAFVCVVVRHVVLPLHGEGWLQNAITTQDSGHPRRVVFGWPGFLPNLVPGRSCRSP